MEIKVRARTSKVGSEVTKVITVDDGDFVGISKEDKDRVITEAAQEALLQGMIEWDWQEA